MLEIRTLEKYTVLAQRILYFAERKASCRCFQIATKCILCLLDSCLIFKSVVSTSPRPFWGFVLIFIYVLHFIHEHVYKLYFRGLYFGLKTILCSFCLNSSLFCIYNTLYFPFSLFLSLFFLFYTFPPSLSSLFQNFYPI